MKKFIGFIFTNLLFTSLVYAEETHIDPFSAIEHIKYENGLQAFLAPSNQATNTAVRLEVLVGTEVEGKNEEGISHLLEHVLFRDKELKDEMSYLQLIREAGGEANGYTSDRETGYYGTIPHKKGTWLLSNITKMILEPVITDEYVAKEKGTVELERGKPSPITLFFGFNPMDYIYPKYLNYPDFWETEFGVKFPKYTLSQEQLSNRELTTEQVKDWYKAYYHPKNMRLFVAGKFNREEVLDIIKNKWASLPNTNGKVLPPLPKINPRNEPLTGVQIYGDTPYVYYGTKIWDVSVLDYEVLKSYTEYLAHRLMKEIRNSKGQTYSAHSVTTSPNGYGYAYVSFQTQKENLEDNLTLLKKYIQNEAELGGLTDEQVKAAKDLHISSEYLMRGNEADNMMDLARWYYENYELDGKFESPYTQIVNVSTEDYNKILKNYFKPEKRYEFLYDTYYFFYKDIYLFYFLITLSTFITLRKVATKNFAHDKVHWIRNIKFPPLKTLEIAVLLISGFVFLHIQYALYQVFKLNILQSHVLIAEYLRSIIWSVALLLTCQGFVFFLPRKLFVMDNKLVIKSVSYYSTHIPLSEIKSVEKVKFLSLRFFKLLFQSNYKFRFYYFNPLFWQSGIVFHLNNGKVLFFSVAEAEKVKSEFEGLWRQHSVAAYKAA